MAGEAGGFVQDSLLSPPPSSRGSISSGLLPRPRSHPLKSGGNKESAFIDTVDERIAHITRMIANKEISTSYEQHHAQGFEGYTSFRQVARDISRVIDLVWVSGTPSLQISFLVRIALMVLTHIPSFPPAPRSMFKLINKLDYAFASLILGHDMETGESLPGLGHSLAVNATERVRIKSLAERTRVVVVQAMKSSESEDEDGDAEDASTSGTERMGGSFDVEELPGSNDMEIARIYDRTLVELGDTVGGPAIGVQVV